MARQLAVSERTHTQARDELDLRRDGEPEERRNRPVRAVLAEQRALERRVGPVECRVVPVEPAAGLCGRDQQSEQDHRPQQRDQLAW